MSSPFTAAFLKAWRSGEGTRASLVRVDLASPSAKTIYLSTSALKTSDGIFWSPCIERCDPIVERDEYLGPGPVISATGFVLRDVTIGTARLTDLLASHAWVAASVRVYWWTTALSDFSTDAACVFRGVVDAHPQVTTDGSGTGISLTATANRSWNRRFPAVEVTKSNYPGMPQSASGRFLPELWGDGRSVDGRWPWGTNWDRTYMDDAGVTWPLAHALQVNTGLGTAKVRVLLAGHKTLDARDTTSGTNYYGAATESAEAVILSSGITEINTDSECGIEIDDDTMQFKVGLPLVDVVTTGSAVNSAGDPKNAMDTGDETTYAVLDQGAGKNALRLWLPNAPPLGTLIQPYWQVGYVTDAGNTHSLRGYLQDPSGAAGPVTTIAASTSPTATGDTFNTAWYDADSWNFNTNSKKSGVMLTLDFAGGTTNKASIFYAVMTVVYKPAQTLVIAGTPPFVTHALPGNRPGQSRGVSFAPGLPPIYSFEGGAWGACGTGHVDWAGDYEGGSLVIELTPDVVRHMMVRHGGLHVTNDFETGASSFGSFVAARALKQRDTTNRLKHFLSVGDRTTVIQEVGRIAADGLMQVVYDSLTGKWQIHPWVIPTAANYDLMLRPEMCESVSQFGSHDESAITSMRVEYAYSPIRGRSRWTGVVKADASAAGYMRPTTRWARKVLTASDNVVRFRRSSTDYDATVTTGTYSDCSTLAGVLQRLMQAAGVTDFACGYGAEIRSGGTTYEDNDKGDFSWNGSSYTCTAATTRGDYQQSAKAIQDAMNAVGVPGVTFTATWNNNGTFTIAGSSGTGALLPVSGSNARESLWRVLGLNADTSTAASHNLSAGMLRFRFWMRTTSDGSYKWTVANSAREHFGFNAEDSADVSYKPGDHMTSAFEATMAAQLAKHGNREQPLEIELRSICDPGAAETYMLCMAELATREPHMVTVTTPMVPDLQVGRVLSFHASMDSAFPYTEPGSDGSWTNKLFRVLSIERESAPYVVRFTAVRLA